MGFLHALPEDWKKTRGQIYQAHDVDPGLPDIEAGEYFIEWLSGDLGWCDADGMGNLRPLAWSEIEAYARACGLDMEPWEARQVRAMSVAYVEGQHRGKTPMVVAPVYDSRDDDPGIALERRLVSDKIKAGLSR